MLTALEPNVTRSSFSALHEVEAELCMLHAAISTNRARMIDLIGHIDATGAWAATGATSTADWLVKLLDLDVATAREQVRVARALRSLPSLATALADGDLSYAKARSATRVATPGNEADVLALANLHTAAALPAALALWQQGADPAAHRDRQVAERSLTARTDSSGNRIITIVLPPEHAAVVEAVIDAQLHVMPNPDATDAPAGASDPAQKVHPSLAQLRADAFVTLVDRLADPTPDQEAPPNAPAGASESTESGGPSTGRGPRRARVELTLHRRVGEEAQLDARRLLGGQHSRRAQDPLDVASEAVPEQRWVAPRQVWRTRAACEHVRQRVGDRPRRCAGADHRGANSRGCSEELGKTAAAPTSPTSGCRAASTTAWNTPTTPAP